MANGFYNVPIAVNEPRIIIKSWLIQQGMAPLLQQYNITSLYFHYKKSDKEIDKTPNILSQNWNSMMCCKKDAYYCGVGQCKKCHECRFKYIQVKKFHFLQDLTMVMELQIVIKVQNKRSVILFMILVFNFIYFKIILHAIFWGFKIL